MSAHAQVSTAVRDAVRDGRLTRASSCEACGKTDVQTVLHHHDYEMPLDVIPVCQSCHRKIHNGFIAEPRTGRTYRRGEAMACIDDVRAVFVDSETHAMIKAYARADGRTISDSLRWLLGAAEELGQEVIDEAYRKHARGER